MNLCEPKCDNFIRYTLIIRYLAIIDLLFVRVSRYKEIFLNILLQSIKNIAVGIVYFVGQDRREIYLRCAFRVVPHGPADDAYRYVVVFSRGGP